MSIHLQKLRATANFTRYHGQKEGHYESYFLRANHPQKPFAFWIRYTLFSPKNHPEKALAELWAVWFNGETKKHTAVKKEMPIEKATYYNYHFALDFEGATLSQDKAVGEITLNQNKIIWNLHFTSQENPLFLLPLSAYELPFPKAKSLVSQVLARFNGEIVVNSEKYIIENWVGSQNHNWGERHTDEYAWGQVAGFDNAPESFLEVGSAKIDLGLGFKTPFLTPLVLRHNGKEYALNSWVDIALARANLKGFCWTFFSENKYVAVEGKIETEPANFVGLTYYNPPGGNKFCLNSKIASCTLKVREKSKLGLNYELYTKNRAAFEILTDNSNHGIPMYI